tara:strand:- start:259 stop:519 length:261 start_codon:yes stop_codon:yes gene_type:complete
LVCRDIIPILCFPLTWLNNDVVVFFQLRTLVLFFLVRIVINDLDDEGIVANNIIFLGGVLVAIVILRTVLLIRARVYFIYNEILSA